MPIELDPVTRPTITVEQMCAVLGIARSTGYEGVRSGEIPSIRVGKRLLIPTAALARMLGLDISTSPAS